MSSIMRKVNILSRCETMYRNEKLTDADLCGRHHSYILAICHNPGLSQEELARHICVNKSNITRTLAHLEGSGYVERKPSQNDKRVTLVYPTDKMLALLPQVQQIARDWNAFLAEGIPEEEIAAFQATLEKMADKAKQYFNLKDEEL